MPSDVVSLVSTGLGVGVLAGILSGVCYVLAHGMTRKRPRNEWSCEVCRTYNDDILNDSIVTCLRCRADVCKAKCSKRIQQTKWVCRKCFEPPKSWFQGILKAIQPNRNVSFGTIMDSTGTLPDPDLESLRKLEKEQVRDFVEKLVNVMLGENVDNASISLLYNDRRYLPIIGQSPCTAHAALKQLIQKLLKEAVNLPVLEKAQEKPAATADDANRTYEDLLSTAIINKVISSCQNNLPSSSANSVSSRLSASSRYKDDKEYFFGEETLDSKWKTTDLDTTSVSSLEDFLQSDSSFGSRKYVDKVTLMIKQDIEEVDNYESENEDEGEQLESSSSFLNDSDTNWFLQKRQFRGTHSPVPVPMLVPNPTTEAKVLIGDKPLDDTSDLSDVGSDYEEPEPLQSTHSILVKSKNVIGGGKTHLKLAENGDGQSESSTDSGVKEVNGKDEKIFDPARADVTVDDDNVEDSSFLSLYSNTEQEAEYTERYASLPRTILKSSTPLSSHEEIKSEAECEKPKENGDIHNDMLEVFGSYSKKEKEKWKHAVEMKNNPYSRENIEKRIKRSNSAASSHFGSDYYLKKAKSPSGGKQRSSEVSLETEMNRLEGISTYSSLPRSLYTPRNSSRNFVQNPLLYFPDNDNSRL